MDFTTQEWLVAIGSVAVLFGYVWWRFRDDILFPFRAKETEGTITNWMTAKEKGITFFYPLIDFKDSRGNSVSYRAEERCEGKPMYTPGTKVKVKYLPKDPKKVKTTYPKANKAAPDFKNN